MISSVRTYMDSPYSMIELKEGKTGTWVRICPERGGIVTGYAPYGQELLYLDRETFLDPSANIRGGNPVLFPISGQLRDGSYEMYGRTYKMKNHGLARISPWTLEASGLTAEGEPFARLRLVSTPGMLESYPFSFELVFTYTLQGSKLVIGQEYSNHSDERMPVYSGFHPYFATSDKALDYKTDATRYLDYNDNQVKDFSGHLDLASLQESVALLNADEPRISFLLPDGRRVSLEYSAAFRYVVLWTAAGKDFVCVEPWMALTGELNRGDELVWIEPGTALSASLSIDASRE